MFVSSPMQLCFMLFVSRTFRYLFMVPSVPSVPSELCDVPVWGFTSFCRCHLIGIYRSYLFLPNRSCPHSAIYTAVMWVACLAFPLPVSSVLIHPAPEGRGWKGSFVCLKGGTGCCLGTSVLLVASPPPAG